MSPLSGRGRPYRRRKYGRHPPRSGRDGRGARSRSSPRLLSAPLLQQGEERPRDLDFAAFRAVRPRLRIPGIDVECAQAAVLATKRLRNRAAVIEPAKGPAGALL